MAEPHSKTEPLNIVFALFPGVTHLDFTGPHQVFSRLPGAEVITASVGGHDITTDGLTFANLADLTKIEACEMVCVPGGFGCAEAMLNDDYMDAIRRLSASAKYVTSVCTGSTIGTTALPTTSFPARIANHAPPDVSSDV